MQNRDVNKILLYVLSIVLLLSTIVMITTTSGLEKLWGLLPFTLGVLIFLLNKFKKIN